MLSNKAMSRIVIVFAVLFALLLSPVVIKAVAFFIVGGAVIFLCPGVRTGVTGDCQNCSSELCPVTVMIVTTALIIIPPITALIVYLSRRRKGMPP
jgi:hypothetical protein